MKKRNRWLPIIKGGSRGILNTFKPRYSLNSSWYRRPSWASLRFSGKVSVQRRDQRYLEWYNETHDIPLDMRSIIGNQKFRISMQMQPMIDDFSILHRWI